MKLSNAIARAAAKKKPQNRLQASQVNRALLDLVLETLDDTKAEDVVVIDLADKSSIADFMVVASGRSSRQIVTMADRVVERLKAHPGLSPSIEGKSQGDWVLIDAGDVIVHLFRPEVRTFYGLEKMWGLPHDEETAAAHEAPAGKNRGQALYA